MTAVSAPARRAEGQADRSFRAGWVLVLLAGIAMLSSTAFVLLVPVDDEFFADTTGRAWGDFEIAEPDVARTIESTSRLLGLTGTAFAALALSVTWSRLRLGDRWAARVLWILPLVLAGYTLLAVVYGTPVLAAFYGPLAVVAAAGLGLVVRAERRAERPWG